MKYLRDEEGNSIQANGTFSISIGTIGLITFIVFLVLKLCNQANPDFEWLTWFWVWFPLWAPIALYLSLLIIAFLCAFVYALITNSGK